MSYPSVDSAASALLKAVGGNESTYKTVATRITLRTGVNLRDPSAAHARDSGAISKVVDAAAKLGYRL